MPPPVHKGRSADQILNEHIYFDSVGYFFRSVSWADYYKRHQSFSSIIYACADARLGIEYLMFEDLIISTGAALSEEEYIQCTKERNRFGKMIKQLSPDYDKLKEFARAVVELDADAPKLIFWDHGDLLKKWGKLSSYLHWFGAISHTTDDPKWAGSASEEIIEITEAIWAKSTPGRMGIMPVSKMEPKAKEVWEDFKNGNTDYEGLKIRLQIVR